MFGSSSTRYSTGPQRRGSISDLVTSSQVFDFGNKRSSLGSSGLGSGPGTTGSGPGLKRKTRTEGGHTPATVAQLTHCAAGPVKLNNSPEASLIYLVGLLAAKPRVELATAQFQLTDGTGTVEVVIDIEKEREVWLSGLLRKLLLPDQDQQLVYLRVTGTATKNENGEVLVRAIHVGRADFEEAGYYHVLRCLATSLSAPSVNTTEIKSLNNPSLDISSDKENTSSEPAPDLSSVVLPANCSDVSDPLELRIVKMVALKRIKDVGVPRDEVVRSLKKHYGDIGDDIEQAIEDLDGRGILLAIGSPDDGEVAYLDLFDDV